MRRREFIVLLGGAAGWPRAAAAQQPAMPAIGYLNIRGPNDDLHLLAAFCAGLREAGYIEGQNATIEYRFAQRRYDRLSALAADLVRRQVAVIAVMGGQLASVAKAATATIPIVFYLGEDPIQLGLVASLARPGGNLTGVTSLNSELGPKRLALLHEMIPSLRAVAVLLNPANAGTDLMAKELRAAAGSRGLEVDLLHAAEESEFEKVFASAKQRSGGLVIGNDSFFISRSERLAALALQHALPAVFTFREFAAAGGLMSYGGELADGYRLAGIYTGQILKGRKPGDLPVQQSTKVELIINLKTARALGLTIPLTLLGRADEVIE